MIWKAIIKILIDLVTKIIIVKINVIESIIIKTVNVNWDNMYKEIAL